MLFPIVLWNYLIALYCSHVAFIILGHCVMHPFVCWVSHFFLPPPAPPLHSLNPLHPPAPRSLLLPLFFPSTCFWPPSVSLSVWLALVFLRSVAVLAVSSSGDSDTILSYIVTRQYCDGVPGGNLLDPEYAFSTRGGRCLPSRAKQRYI